MTHFDHPTEYSLNVVEHLPTTMDSKQLYIAGEHYGSLIQWGDWIHIGKDDELKEDLIINYIDSHLIGDELIITHLRSDSTFINKNEVLEKIRELLGDENFTIWTKNFNKAIQFNRIGVVNIGVLVMNNE